MAITTTRLEDIGEYETLVCREGLLTQRLAVSCFCVQIAAVVS